MVVGVGVEAGADEVPVAVLDQGVHQRKDRATIGDCERPVRREKVVLDVCVGQSGMSQLGAR